ncbi:MAG TPA: cell division protein ZapB [bacterium]|nr:cell division protein ZapB [bacterium]
MFSNTSLSWDLPDEDFDRSNAAGAPSVAASAPTTKPSDSPQVSTSTPPQKPLGNTTVGDLEFEHHPSKIFGIFGDKEDSASETKTEKPSTKTPINTPFDNTKEDKTDIDIADWGNPSEPIDDEIFGVPDKVPDLTDKISPDDFFKEDTKPLVPVKETQKPADKPKPFPPILPPKPGLTDDSALRKQLDELRTKATDTTGKMKELVDQLNDLIKQTTDAVSDTERRNEELKRSNEELEKKHKRLTDLINQARADLQ